MSFGSPFRPGTAKNSGGLWRSDGYRTRRLIHAHTELMEDVTALAERSLSDRLAGISVKAAARAVVKYAVWRKALGEAHRWQQARMQGHWWV